MKKAKLKIGVLLESNSIPSWAYHALEKVVNSQSAEIKLIIKNASVVEQNSGMKRLWGARSRIGYHIYNGISRKLFRTSEDAFAIKSIDQLITDVPEIAIVPIKKKFSDHFKPSDVEKIQQHDLDIIVRMGFRILKGDILNVCSKYGVWSYHHGDNRVNRGGPPGYWETVDSWDTNGSILQVLSADLDGGKILYRSWSLSSPLSLAQNRNGYYWTSSSFLSRQIDRLYQVGAERFFKEVEKFDNALDFYSHKLVKAPTNLAVVKHSAKAVYKLAVRVWQKLFLSEQWILLFKIDKGVAKSFHRFKKIIPPNDRFWADPHVIFKDDKYFIFVEEYLYKTKLGRLAVLEVDKKGRVGEPITILEKDYHLSYPNVFELDGKYYMIPETSANKTIDIYECVGFPHQWAFKMSLMTDIDAVDTTLLFHNDKWWLFANVAENKGSSKNDELFLYYADELFTTSWTAHAQNPIISDTSCSRPAGKIFAYNERLYRPSQDCSGLYGRGFNMAEIKELSEEVYEEDLVSTHYTDWDDSLLGVHCFNYQAGMTVIDAFRRRRKFL